MCSSIDVQNDRKALEEAAAYLQAAEKLDPDSPSVRLASAWTQYLLEASTHKPGRLYSRALEVDPGNSDAWMLLRISL